ncbi:PaaI family thioesterase [Tistrella bauzanensis]|uniref:PaaI family thioesterase n=1 Tax=Tistrella arctica TaxID=3133430 RepID=A0ABU9YDH4_9PROT
MAQNASPTIPAAPAPAAPVGNADSHDDFDPWGALPDAVLDPVQEKRVRAGLGAQGFMALVGATITAIGAGRCQLSVTARPELMQNHGVFHGGVIGFLIDNACAAAAGTMAPLGHGVMTADYGVSLLAAATGGQLVADARVVRAGRRLTTVEARVHVLAQGRAPRLVATGRATVAVIEGRESSAAAATHGGGPA